MNKFLAILKKDALIMLRDWPGLMILFIMPAVLLVIITFTQESAIPSRKSGMRIAIADSDSGDFGRSILRDLASSEYFNFNIYNSDAEARESVLNGECQMAVIVPDSATEKLYSLMVKPVEDDPAAGTRDSDLIAGAIFIYDPGVQKVFLDAVRKPVVSLIQLTAVKVLMTKYISDINRTVRKQSEEFSESLAENDFFRGIPEFPYRSEVVRRFREEMKNRILKDSEIKLPFSPSFNSALVAVEEVPARENSHEFKPGVLQNNIPAFTLFAMFFIVIPLAGSIINEKNHGTFSRIRTLPVSWFHVAASKITVFLFICILQFIFLMFIGKYIMPLLGEQSTLDLRVNISALLGALVASSLAAAGFGIIVGAFANTHGQAATFGSVMVVILALLGGIFVPVHMLPDAIRKISYVSPLRWGTDAFLDVFARYQGFTGILPELSLLTGFFLISILLSVRVFRKP